MNPSYEDVVACAEPELIYGTGPAADTFIGKVELPDVIFELFANMFNMSSVSSFSYLL